MGRSTEEMKETGVNQAALALSAMDFELLRFSLAISNSTGTTDTSTIARMTTVKFSFTNGRLPK